jgi:NhaP-type Na+/H+ or K+/H+ antiporter
MSMRIGSIFIIMATSAIGKFRHSLYLISILMYFFFLGIFAPIILYRIHPHKEGSPRDWILTAGKFCKYSIK